MRRSIRWEAFKLGARQAPVLFIPDDYSFWEETARQATINQIMTLELVDWAHDI
jgi:hypothetical protein